MERRCVWISLIISGFLAVATMGAAQGGRWAEKADMPKPRFGVGIAVVRGKIYVIGGARDAALNATLATVHEYDPKTDTWTKKANMPTERYGLAASAVGGKIYAIGGWNGDALSTVEEYDPRTNRWTERADMPEPRYTLSTSMVDDKIYAIAGSEGQGFTSTVFEYDPAMNKWTKKANMPQGVYWGATSVVNKKIYAFGGSHFFHEQGYPHVREYDPATDTWTRNKHMKKPQMTATSAVDSQIYVIGGWSHWDDKEDDKGFLDEVFLYDPPTETWTEVENMPTPRRPSTAVVNGRVYAIGGTRVWPPDPLGTVELYTPEGWIPRAVSPQGKLTTTWGNLRQRLR